LDNQTRFVFGSEKPIIEAYKEVAVWKKIKNNYILCKYC
jgi:hypothetical protein